MKKLLLFGILGFITISSCDKIDNCIPISKTFFEGKWIDYKTGYYGLGGRAYDIKFDKDSFFLHKYEYTDLISLECDTTSSWDIYSKGSYDYTNNELVLKGFYCDENYQKLIIPPCSVRIDTGVYNFEFDRVSYCNDTLILQNTSQSAWHGLLKLKKE